VLATEGATSLGEWGGLYRLRCRGKRPEV
jgi:hypothetical protein